jgi:pimeloyl-ACP methyl ester carboxylesterase
VVPGLAERFRVLAYDRRGHSRSERPAAPGSVDEDGDDLAALLEALDLAPAHVAANSWGGNIALRLATRRPDLFRSLACHEPPLWSLLEGDAETRRGARSLEEVGRRIAAGDHEGAARQFVEEVAFGAGAWERELPPEMRAVFVHNAPTFLGELRDPDQLAVDPEALAHLEIPVRLTEGSESPPVFRRVIDRLEQLIPDVTREVIDGAAHVPQLTNPERYVEITTRALRAGKATDFTVTAASGGSAEDHDQSPGAARRRRPPEQIASTVPSGAATNSSTMSGIGTSIPRPAGSQESPPSGDTTIRPPRPTRSAGPASTRSGRVGGTSAARV